MSGLKDINSIIAITKPRPPEEAGAYLFYGLPGTGKTRLAGSASEVESMGKVLLIDFENGSSVLSLHHPDVDVAPVEDWQQAEDLIFFLVDEEHEYRTVIIDTAGEAQHVIMASSNDDNPYEKWDDAWRKLTAAVKILHKSGKLNVILLAHAENERSDFDGRKTVRPYFQGKRSLNELPKVFDVIGYLHIDEEDEETRILQLKPLSDTMGKDRFGMFPNEVENPTMAKLVGFMQDARSKKTTKKEAK